MAKAALLSAITVAFGLLVLQGCKSDTAKDAKMESVLVLEKGLAPQFPLRYRIEEGAKTTSTMEISTSAMTATTSDGEELANAPGLRFVVSSGPAMKLPSGNIRFDVRILEAEAILPPGIDPEVARDYTTSAAVLSEVGGWIEVDDQGIVVRSELNQAAKNPDLPIRLLMTLVQARTSLARVALPPDPVGVGARWEARKRVEVFGFEIVQIDRYRLEDKVRDELRLSVEIAQSAPKRTVTFEEQGVEYTLQSLSVSARGTITLSLDALEGTARVEGRSTEVLTVKSSGASERIELDAAFRVELDPTDAAR